MSINRRWLNEFRYVPRKIKTGWFSSKNVYVLQQRYHDIGVQIDSKGWDYCESHRATIVRIQPINDNNKDY